MKKKLYAFLLAVLMLLTILPGAALAYSYSDVQPSWYADAVNKFGDSDIFAAAGGKFYPDKQITKIEFVRLLHKTLGISIQYFAPTDIAADFSDMKNTDIGAAELTDLVAAGIVEKGGSFGPDRQLDRDVMIHWIMNALSYKSGGKYPIPMVKPVPFSDDSQITDAYRGEMYSARALKLSFGRGDNIFAPREGATRAEAVTVVARLLDLLSGGSNPVGQTVAVSAAAKETDGALVMTLTILNNSGKAVTITHGGQTYDFQLLDAKGETVYTWSADKMFIAIASDTVIAAGQSVTYTETLDKDAYAAIKPSVAAMKAFIVATTKDFAIDPNGYTGQIS